MYADIFVYLSKHWPNLITYAYVPMPHLLQMCWLIDWFFVINFFLFIYLFQVTLATFATYVLITEEIYLFIYLFQVTLATFATCLDNWFIYLFIYFIISGNISHICYICLDNWFFFISGNISLICYICVVI